MLSIITKIRHDWPEKANFRITRPFGHKEYTFLHFTTSVEFEIDGKIIKARPDACIFYSPETPQFFYSDKPIVHNWMHAKLCFGDILNGYNIPQNQILYPNNTAFISEIFHKMEQEHFSSNRYKDQLINTYLNEFLINFARSINNETVSVAVPRKETENMSLARKQILSKPEHKWTVAEMADLVALSPSHFHRIYKSLFGTSPMHDVIDARIRYAKSLLLSDQRLTLPCISEMLGYNDQYHFIRQFKSVVGQTPGAYRKKRR